MKGYRQIHVPEEPKESQYPILFPALIAMGQLFFNTPLTAKIMVSLFSILCTLFLFYLTKDIFSYLLFPLLLLNVNSSLFLEYSSIIMSEIPLCLSVLAALLVYQKSIENPRNLLLYLCTLTLSILPIHCKSIGVAFSLSFIVITLLSRQYKYVFGHIILLVISIVLFRSMTSWESPYILQLFQRSSYNPEMGLVSLGEMTLRIVTNAKKYGGFLIGNVLWPFLYAYPVYVRIIISSMVSLLTIVGIVRLATTPLRVVSIYLLCYFGILLLWQEQWSSARFLASVVPFLFITFLVGVDSVLYLLSVKKGTFIKSIAHLGNLTITTPSKQKCLISWGIVILLIIGNLAHQQRLVTRNRKQSQDWKNFYACADWIRTNTPKESIVMSRKAELCYLRSQRKGITYPFTHDTQKMLSILSTNKVRYILCDNFYWTHTSIRYLYPLFRSYPNLFTVVYSRGNPDTYVVEYMPR